MPYLIQNYYPLRQQSYNNGVLTSDTGTGFYSVTLESNKTVLQRRTKPSDLFANGTAYSAYRRFVSDLRYNKFSGGHQFLTIQPIQHDVNLTWVPFTANLTGMESRLRAKIKDMNANLAQNVAEYRQASSMFAGLAMNIVQTFRSIRSGRAISDFIRILRQPRSKSELAIANRWLQYQYGLKPLMSDLYGTTEALAKGIRSGMYQHVRSRVSDGYNREFKSSDGNFVTHFVKATINGTARYKISDPSLKQLSQFGITNPLLLAWELIPYSFVIDWMFPVGNFLSSLDALNGTSDLRAVVSSWEEHTITVNAPGGGRGDFIGQRYTRNAPVSNLALPKLSYKPSTSLTAVANGMALLTQLRRR